MWFQFARKLAAQWLALAGGTAVSVALMLWSAMSGREPAWWVYASVAAVSFVGASFGAWKAERARATLAEQALDQALAVKPVASLAFEISGFHICLRVTNTGAQGAFRAVLEAKARKMRLSAPAIWEHTVSHEPVVLGHLSSGRLKLAKFIEDRRTAYFEDSGDTLDPHVKWELQYFETPGFSFFTVGSSNLRDEEPKREWATVQVNVYSDPELRDRVASRTLRLVGRSGVDDDSGERLTPMVLVREEYDPQDAWDR